MPAYLSLISGLSVEELEDGANDSALRRQVMRACFGFVAGFSTIFILLGASATVVGRVLRTWHAEILGVEFGVSQIAGIVIIVMGLHIAGVFRIHVLYRDSHVRIKHSGTNLLSAFLVGAAFAFGWSPCIGPILSGILTIAASRSTVYQGIGLLAVYSAGLAVPFLLAGWSIQYFFRAFGRIKHHFRKLEVASGALLVVIGVLVMTDQLSRLNSYFAFLSRLVNSLERVLL